MFLLCLSVTGGGGGGVPIPQCIAKPSQDVVPYPLQEVGTLPHTPPCPARPHPIPTPCPTLYPPPRTPPRYAASLITSLMTIETHCTVLCSMIYTRSCMNLIGWFQVTTTLDYMLSGIPVGLSSSCVVNSLCQTMKWASAGAVEGVHGMLSPGCFHISPRTASLTPFPVLLEERRGAKIEIDGAGEKVATSLPGLPPRPLPLCFVRSVEEQKLNLMQGTNQGQCRGVCVDLGCKDSRKGEGGQGRSPVGDVETSWEEHSMHTFNCSCAGPFHGLRQAVDYT